jgi:hypothetical protein
VAVPLTASFLGSSSMINRSLGRRWVTGLTTQDGKTAGRGSPEFRMDFL